MLAFGKLLRNSVLLFFEKVKHFNSLAKTASMNFSPTLFYTISIIHGNKLANITYSFLTKLFCYNMVSI